MPNLGRQSPSASSPSKTEGKTSLRQSSKTSKRRRSNNGRRRRRSTLDNASAPQFGIDAETHLMARSINRRHEDDECNNNNTIAAASSRHDYDKPGVIRLVSEDNSNNNYSPASSINSIQQRGSVDRDAALSMHPAPIMFTMANTTTNNRGIVPSNNNNDHGGLPPTMLSRRDSAGSRCSVTCASSDTVHRNNVSSSRSSILNNGRGYDCVTPLGNSDPSSFQQVAFSHA